MDRKPLISAYLSPMYGSEWSGDRGKNVYRLDFKTKESARVGSFVLKEPSEYSNPFDLSMETLITN